MSNTNLQTKVKIVFRYQYKEITANFIKIHILKISGFKKKCCSKCKYRKLLDLKSMEKRIIPVILCGGSGVRLWPLSREDYPKQFNVLFGENSMLPSDHMISDEQAFCQTILSGLEACNEGKIVTFGIKPNRAETGYGYLEVDFKKKQPVYNIKKFIEKPNLAVAQKMSQSESYLFISCS